MTFNEYLEELARRAKAEQDSLPVGSEWHHCYPEWVDIVAELPLSLRETAAGAENLQGWVWHGCEIDGVLLFFRFLRCEEPGRTEPLSLARGIPMMAWFPPSTHPELQKKTPSGHRHIVRYEYIPTNQNAQTSLFGEEMST